MGKSISLFNDYHTKENILSNHCGVILKLLYEENPKGFEEVITTLTSHDFEIAPNFNQQIKKKASIPDIVIEQKSFSIFFETKTFDWFYNDQIDRHLKGIPSSNNYKILFLLSNFEIDDIEERFSKQIKTAKQKYDITLCPISFEQLIETLEEVEATDNFKEFLKEFEDFLDRNNYLPTWKYLLDVVNCANTIHEIYDNNVYMCPDSGGMYSHRRAMYFGAYKQKNVKNIYEIKAIVVIEKGGKTGFVKWSNFGDDDKSLIEEAKDKINLYDYRKREIEDRNVQVFLLQNPRETNFRKISSGGLFGSKKYFYNIARDVSNSTELSNKLKNKTWE